MYLVIKLREALMYKWGLPDCYDIIKSENLDIVRFPPLSCIVVYILVFELGLRLPVHPFIRDLLDFLNVIVANLYPNA